MAKTRSQTRNKKKMYYTHRVVVQKFNVKLLKQAEDGSLSRHA